MLLLPPGTTQQRGMNLCVHLCVCLPVCVRAHPRCFILLLSTCDVLAFTPCSSAALTQAHTHTPTDSKAYLTHLSRRLWSTVMQPRGEQATLSLLVEHWRGAAWNKTQFPFVSWWKFCAHAAACEVAKRNSNVCLCERVRLMRGPGHPFQRDPKNAVLYLCPMTVRCTWTKVDEVDNRGNLLLSRWQICVRAFPNTGAASDPDASLGGGVMATSNLEETLRHT